MLQQHHVTFSIKRRSDSSDKNHVVSLYEKFVRKSLEMLKLRQIRKVGI